MGRGSFWFWMIGFWVAFTPLRMGLMGVTRRMSQDDDHLAALVDGIAAVVPR